MALCFPPIASVAVPTEPIERRILLVRGHKVMLDADLAELYGNPRAGKKALAMADRSGKMDG